MKSLFIQSYLIGVERSNPFGVGSVPLQARTFCGVLGGSFTSIFVRRNVIIADTCRPFDNCDLGWSKAREIVDEKILVGVCSRIVIYVEVFKADKLCNNNLFLACNWYICYALFGVKCMIVVIFKVAYG